MNAVVELLNRLAAWLDAYRRRRRAAQAQAERDRLADDPRAWYRHHFGGVRDDGEPPGTGSDHADADDRRESE